MPPKKSLTEKCSIRPSCSSGENPVTSSFFGRLSRLLLPPGGCPLPLPACCVCWSPLATHFVALPRTTVPRPLPSRPIAAACNHQDVSRFGWQTLPHYIVYNNNLQHYIYIYTYIFFFYSHMLHFIGDYPDWPTLHKSSMILRHIKHTFNFSKLFGNGRGVVVKLMVCWAKGPEFEPRSQHYTFKDFVSPASKLWYDWNFIILKTIKPLSKLLPV